MNQNKKKGGNQNPKQNKKNWANKVRKNMQVGLVV